MIGWAQCVPRCGHSRRPSIHCTIQVAAGSDPLPPTAGAHGSRPASVAEGPLVSWSALLTCGLHWADIGPTGQFRLVTGESGRHGRLGRQNRGRPDTSGAETAQAERAGRGSNRRGLRGPAGHVRVCSDAASTRPGLRLRRPAAMMGRAGGRFYVLVGPGRTAVCWLWGPPWATLSAMAQACLAVLAAPTRPGSHPAPLLLASNAGASTTLARRLLLRPLSLRAPPVGRHGRWRWRGSRGGEVSGAARYRVGPLGDLVGTGPRGRAAPLGQGGERTPRSGWGGEWAAPPPPPLRRGLPWRPFEAGQAGRRAVRGWCNPGAQDGRQLGLLGAE